MIIKKHSLLLIGIACISAVLVGALSVPLVLAHRASGPRTWNAVVGIESPDHAVQGMSILPTQLWINVGDTVVWTFKSGEPHTVTFLQPGEQLPQFNPTDPLQVKQQGGTNYDGKSYYNSGLMSSLNAAHPVTCSLTFGVSGDFVYHCLVHPSMLGIIHVQPAGTNYPFTQEDYDRQIQDQTRSALKDGESLVDEATQLSKSEGHVIVGIGDDLVMLVRFYPQNITTHVGDTVTFMNHDPMAPHTVTFGPEQPNLAKPYGNPQAYDGKEPLNSGYLGMDLPQGASFSVKFVKAGTFPFDCALHDQLGMKGVVTVLP